MLYFQLLLIFSCPMAAGAAEYSLHDLYRVALERSEVIRIAGENINFSLQERNRALSLLWPRIVTSAGYTKFSDEVYNTSQYTLPSAAPGIPPQSLTEDVLVQPDHAWSYGVRAEENLSLSLRELTAVEMGTNDIRKSTFDLHTAQEDYLLQVAQAYYMVFMAKKRLDIASSNLDRVSIYRGAAQSRLNVGEITETVLLRADSELSSAKADMVRARNAITLANATLVRLTGIPKESTLLEEPPRVASPPALPDLVKTAYEERPEIQSLSYQKTIAEQQVSFAEDAYWPRISVAAEYQRNEQSPDSVTANERCTYGSISLIFPLYEGGLRRAEVEQAKVRERQARLSLENQKKTVALEVERAYLDLMTRKGTLDFLRDQLKFAQDNYRGVSRQFSLGLASSIDVIDANSLLVSSERQLADASYAYQLSILEVERATGTFMKEVR
jgi:outer membrane protein